MILSLFNPSVFTRRLPTMGLHGQSSSSASLTHSAACRVSLPLCYKSSLMLIIHLLFGRPRLLVPDISTFNLRCRLRSSRTTMIGAGQWCKGLRHSYTQSVDATHMNSSLILIVYDAECERYLHSVCLLYTSPSPRD